MNIDFKMNKLINFQNLQILEFHEFQKIHLMVSV